MKYVYFFNEGDADMRNLLGGKGANLCEMTKLGLPVPQGFVVSTEACTSYYENNQIVDGIKNQIFENLTKLEKETGKTFGSEENPLILSIRSGARISMPGMMDSVLDLGLNDKIVKSFAKQVEPKFAYDCYRRFIQMYGNVVKGIKDSLFEKEIDKVKKSAGVKTDQELSVKDLQDLIKNYKEVYKKEIKKPFPQDVKELLIDCIESVFKSWNNERAIMYREFNNIPSEWGTAVNVQQMVFGNLNEQSGTGVCFSRNPSTGENIIFGEFLMKAQGEDIVAGVRTPNQIIELKNIADNLFVELQNYLIILENYYKDMQDIEFTIENGKLYILQTRNGKRTANASIKIAVDLVKENQIDKESAIQRVEINKINELLHSNLEITENNKPIAKGIPASPGGVCGRICFKVSKAKYFKDKGEKTILVRYETSAEDIEGMSIADAILTARGGMTSHAAVVARGMGKVCITGCDSLAFKTESIKIGKYSFKEGDIISVDGTTGNIYNEEIKTANTINNQDLEIILNWAKEIRKIKVLANADTPLDAENAIKFKADGIGLCRTEHMFFEKTRIKEMRKMILATNLKEREIALKNLLPLQKNDFAEMFITMQDKPLTIRLLDPPLHEFLPKAETEIKELAKEIGITFEEIKARIHDLKEINPMMGHRGLRLAISYPEIYEMQAKAIIQGAIIAEKKTKLTPKIEIMIPLTSTLKEYLFVKDIITKTIKDVLKDKEIPYQIGTMIETPRAVLIASDLALNADFFSFGTNDLTQLTFGFSRDDSAKFIKDYQSKKIFDHDIFKTIDTEGVGKMIELAIKSAKRINPNIKIGICGEHGGDPDSINYFKNIGVDYVSCSVFRVPVAIISAI